MLPTRIIRWVLVGVGVVVVVGVVAILIPEVRAWLFGGGALLGASVLKRGRANGQRRREVEDARRTVELNTAERNERIHERAEADAARVDAAPTETAMPDGMTDEQRAEAERLRGLW